MFAVIHVLYATSEESARRLSAVDSVEGMSLPSRANDSRLVQLLKAEQSDDTSSTVRFCRLVHLVLTSRARNLPVCLCKNREVILQ